ncbi:uncharacterized protein LOC127845007 [Dreissena polymorpha]|nr:uncharacterized protein LOC127845007 [Dreissena polymorpha]
MFDYSPVCMPVFSMGVFLRGLHTLPRGARYSMKFYVERTDSIPWSNTIQNHAMSWNRSLMISKLHWNIFIAATIIGLIISGFAVYVTVRFLKRKVPSDSVITDLDVELTQISQETTLQDVPHAIKNENITQMLPWQPPRYVSETHPNDGIENSHLLQRD